MRRHRHRKRSNKQKKIIIIISVGLIFVMTAGYAAFSTNLNITAKGNIRTPNASQQLEDTVVSSGDGLYEDPNVQDPNNYITFNNKTWRIISIENDNTLKIFKEEAIDNMPWDERTTETTGPRLNDNNTYCQLYPSGYYYGCNAWSSVTGTFTNGQYSGTVTQNASLNNYLNNTYYQSLSAESKEIIENHEFNAGAVAMPTTTNPLPISEVIDSEKQFIWNGDIALLNVSDYLNASLDEGCNSLFSARNDGGVICRNQNYLYNDNNTYQYSVWLLNPWKNTQADVWIISYGSLSGSGTNSSLAIEQYVSRHLNVHPVVFLKANINLSGNGTADNPYKINKIL